MRNLVLVLSISALLLIVACGSSSHSVGPTSTAGGNPIVTSGNNVAPLTVNAGPVASNRAFNQAFTTVVVCAPGTSNCVTIDNVWVDTGSTGLRIPSDAFQAFSNGATVLAALQNVNPSTPVAECVQFLDNSFFWGTVRFADVKMGGASNTGEVAASVPIHVTGDTSIPTGASIPSDCSTVFTAAGSEEDTVAALGANGLLGVGNFQYDCDVLGFGNPCASPASAPSGMYYTCSASSCSISAVSLGQQLRNPVSAFAADNNGVIIEMPGVPVGGQPEIATGQASLVFGIGTQSNNGLGSATVLPLDSNMNDAAYMGITTVFNGISYPGSFLDSGSNVLLFLDQPTSGIPTCGNFYCPTSTEGLTATNKASNGANNIVQFNVSNANTLLNSGNSAFSDLAAPVSVGVPDSATQADDAFFDWGAPFFYGRNVYTSIWFGGSASPFWAY